MKITSPLRRIFSRVANDNKNPPPPNGLTKEKLDRALNPPHDGTVDVLHGTPVPDPFRPLEKLEAPETAAWIKRENERFDAYMQGTEKDKRAILSFFNRSYARGPYESMPGKYGDKYMVWRYSDKGPRLALYIKDVPDYGAPAKLLIDPMKIDPSGKTALIDKHVSPDNKIVAYRLSASGADKEVLRFLDMETGKDLDLTYDDWRSSVIWDADSKGFHYTQSNAETKSTEVRYHKMGTKREDDKVVFRPTEPETSVGYYRLGKYEFISVSRSRSKLQLMVRPTGAAEKFRDIPACSPIAEINGKIYATSTRSKPNGRLVSFDINNPDTKNWKTVLPENKEDQLENAFIWQDKIFATYLHDTGQQLKVFDLDGKFLHDVPIPPLSTFTLGQRMKDGTCLISYNNFQEDGNVYKYDAKDNSLTLHKKSTTPVDLKDCIVERVLATSKDGTKIPMTVIRHPDTKLDGTAATLLYGYGGFANALEPSFSLSVAQWVKAGGIYVQANLRGGGEFGQKWYDGGRQENKQNTFDDFAACAKHLIDNKYTSNKRLAIEGGSNGGLLTLATVIQNKDLFGAVISAVPVTDMFRFHIGSYYGYSWKSDYGDPDIKKDFNTAAKYSPLHNVKEGWEHPPILIKTDVNDVRVLPWHSYKMAATLQTKEDPNSLTLLKIREGGGHGAGMTTEQRYEEIASIRAWLAKVIGPINQNEYKAKLAHDAKMRTKVVGFVKRKFG